MPCFGACIMLHCSNSIAFNLTPSLLARGSEGSARDLKGRGANFLPQETPGIQYRILRHCGIYIWIIPA